MALVSSVMIGYVFLRSRSPRARNCYVPVAITIALIITMFLVFFLALPHAIENDLDGNVANIHPRIHDYEFDEPFSGMRGESESAIVKVVWCFSMLPILTF